jgi:formate dehydrogenase major subunit
MSYERLAREQGLHWPCPTIDGPDSPFLHGRLWEDPPVGPLAPFSAVEHAPPIEALDDEYPMRLTTGRRLESFNTGVQSGGYRSPLRRDETIDIHPEDGLNLGIADGELVRVVSRRGKVEVAARYDEILRPGLAFMTFHFPDDVATNLLTINATDPKSGTAEFKACAVRIEKLPAEARRELAAAAGGDD